MQFSYPLLRPPHLRQLIIQPPPPLTTTQQDENNNNPLSNLNKKLVHPNNFPFLEYFFAFVFCFNEGEDLLAGHF